MSPVTPLKGRHGRSRGSVAQQVHDRVGASHGSKDGRLARIKADYAPDNLFRHNANILPATP